MAVVEVNASMGCIVAAPTAGASGILPGVLIESAHERGWTDDQLVDALFTAGAIGLIFAKNATISGAGGGCQAETGVAAAMAAAALVEISGGAAVQALDAAAMAIKNVLGACLRSGGGIGGMSLHQAQCAWRSERDDLRRYGVVRRYQPDSL